VPAVRQTCRVAAAHAELGRNTPNAKRGVSRRENSAAAAETFVGVSPRPKVRESPPSTATLSPPRCRSSQGATPRPIPGRATLALMFANPNKAAGWFSGVVVKVGNTPSRRCKGWVDAAGSGRTVRRRRWGLRLSTALTAQAVAEGWTPAAGAERRFCAETGDNKHVAVGFGTKNPVDAYPACRRTKALTSVTRVLGVNSVSAVARWRWTSCKRFPAQTVVDNGRRFCVVVSVFC